MKSKELSSKLRLPPDLDGVADQWREHFDKHVTINLVKDLDLHVPSSHSIYMMTLTFHKEDHSRLVYYAGQTTNPNVRANTHKSELKCCKTTTRVGKSVLYSGEYMNGVRVIDMHFRVQDSGFTKDEALKAEKALAEDLVRLYGEDLVLTKPTGKKD